MNIKLYRVVNLLLVCLILSSGTVHAETVKEHLKSRVMLSSYEIKGDMAAPGKEITLEMTFANKNPYKDVYSVLISFYSEETEIYPVYGQSNQIYIEKIKAGGEAEVSVSLMLSQSLKKDLVPLGMDISYVDKTDGAGSNTAGIQIPVTQENKLEVEKISVPENNVLGTRTIIGVNYRNAGNIELQKVTLLLEGNVPDNQKVIDLGTMAAGKSQYFETAVNFQEIGEQNLRIRMKYQDPDGQEYEYGSQEYKVSVQEGAGSSAEDFTQEPDRVKFGYSISGIFLAAGCITLLLVLVALIFRKERKGKDMKYE